MQVKTRYINSTHSTFELEDVHLVEFMYLVFTCMPSVSVVNVLVCVVAYLTACVKCAFARVCFNARHVFQLYKSEFTHSDTHNQIADGEN